MKRSSGAIRTACDIQIDGRWGPGRPKLTWKKLTERDCHEWKLTTVDPQDLLCVQLASYLERGPLMWMMPLHLHVNQKSDYDNNLSPAAVVIGALRVKRHKNQTNKVIVYTTLFSVHTPSVFSLFI